MQLLPAHPKFCRAWTWCSGLALAALSTGCTVETQADDAAPHKPLARVEGPDHGTTDPAKCRFSLGRGCLDGHVDAVQSFFVDGKEFFNANDLAARFHELLHVEVEGKDAEAGADGYQLTLITPLDNESFVPGFTYDLKGVRSGDTRNDGSFSIDDLVPGNYDLRVQKTVKFALAKLPKEVPSAPTKGPTPPAPSTAAAASPTTDPAPTSNAAPAKPKEYCATLYEDSEITVRDSQQEEDNLSNLRLHVTADECATGMSQTTILL